MRLEMQSIPHPSIGAVSATSEAIFTILSARTLYMNCEILGVCWLAVQPRLAATPSTFRRRLLCPSVTDGRGAHAADVVQPNIVCQRREVLLPPWSQIQRFLLQC